VRAGVLSWANAIIGILYALETPILPQALGFDPFAGKGKMEPVTQAWAKVVFRIFRDIEPVGEGQVFGTAALAARWLDMILAVKLSFRASGRGVVSLLFGALVGIGGKYRNYFPCVLLKTRLKHHQVLTLHLFLSLHHLGREIISSRLANLLFDPNIYLDSFSATRRLLKVFSACSRLLS
jgi:hypothetical protein